MTSHSDTMATMSRRVRLPGGIAISRLRAYEPPAPDGQSGGAAHIHLACEELYYVTGGEGAVELISAKDGFVHVPLSSGSVLQHAPGVLHRLINYEDFEVLVVMQNAGLPEPGDTIFTFPDADLADASRYAGLALATDKVAALQRRDLTVEGFNAIRHAFERSHDEGTRALRAFYDRAVRLAGDSVNEWDACVDAGPVAANTATQERLSAIRSGDGEYLTDGTLTSFSVATAESDYEPGICGMRWPISSHAVEHLAASGS